MSEFTHRYGEHENTSVLPPYPPAPGHEPPRKNGKARTAGILAAALLVGLAGGVGGAAGFAALDDDPATGSSNGSSAVSPLRTTSGSSDDAPAPSGSPEAVAAQVLPSVVKITVISGSSDGSSLSGQPTGGSGSGIIISADGEILTNNHVVEIGGDNADITVSFNDGSTASATVVGTDPVTDLAVIKVDGVSGLTPATIGDSDKLDVGEDVVAIGSPFGLEATVTSGIVSSLNRPVTVSGVTGTDTTYPAIQTDAAINPGNSGGPLVDLNGEVVGINSSIRTASAGLGSEGGSIGLGFAIPISKVLPIVEQLRNNETPTHARLGVTVSDEAGEAGKPTGAAVESVENGAAGDDAGLKVGDVVTKVNDELISGSESLVATIRGYRPGDEVTLTVVRDGDTKQVKATLDSDEGKQQAAPSAEVQPNE